MVVVREKTTVTQRIHGNCRPIRARKLPYATVIDEPKEREGMNMGPTPTETMVAALIAAPMSSATNARRNRRRVQSHDD